MVVDVKVIKDTVHGSDMNAMADGKNEADVMEGTEPVISPDVERQAMQSEEERESNPDGDCASPTPQRATAEANAHAQDCSESSRSPTATAESSGHSCSEDSTTKEEQKRREPVDGSSSESDDAEETNTGCGHSDVDDADTGCSHSDVEDADTGCGHSDVDDADTGCGHGDVDDADTGCGHSDVEDADTGCGHSDVDDTNTGCGHSDIDDSEYIHHDMSPLNEDKYQDGHCDERHDDVNNVEEELTHCDNIESYMATVNTVGDEMTGDTSELGAVAEADFGSANADHNCHDLQSSDCASSIQLTTEATNEQNIDDRQVSANMQDDVGDSDPSALAAAQLEGADGHLIGESVSPSSVSHIPEGEDDSTDDVSVTPFDSSDDVISVSSNNSDSSSDPDADESGSEESSTNYLSDSTGRKLGENLETSVHFGRQKPKKDGVKWDVNISSVKPDKNYIIKEDSVWKYEKEDLEPQPDDMRPTAVLDLTKAKLLKREGHKLLVEFDDYDDSQLSAILNKGVAHGRDKGQAIFPHLSHESSHRGIHPRLLSSMVPEDEDLSRQDVETLTLKIEDLMSEYPGNTCDVEPGPDDYHRKGNSPRKFESHQEQLRILDNLQYCHDIIRNKFENSATRKRTYRRLLERYDSAIFKAMKGENDVSLLRTLPAFGFPKEDESFASQCLCCDKRFHSERALQMHLDDCVKSTWIGLMKHKVVLKV